MSLALATLIYEWRRYLAAVIALAFSGMMVMAFSACSPASSTPSSPPGSARAPT